MSVYLAMNNNGWPDPLGVYSSSQQALDAHEYALIEEKNVSNVDIKTGVITFSDGSKLVLGGIYFGLEPRLEWDYVKPETKEN